MGGLYGYNTQRRRQAFLSLFLLFFSLSAFWFMIQRTSQNATLYAISYCTVSVAAFITVCSSAFKLQATCLRVSCAFIQTIGALCLLSASINYIQANCTKPKQYYFCASGHFSFDFLYSGIAFVIAFDQLRPLKTKRGRVCCYSFVLFVSSLLQSIYFYKHRHTEGWTLPMKAYQVTIEVMTIMSGLLFLSVGIVDLWICVNIRVYCMHCNVFTFVYSLFSFAMLATGCYIIQSDENLDVPTQGFFAFHLLLNWAIAFRICADTTVGNAHLSDDFERVRVIEREDKFESIAGFTAEHNTHSPVQTIQVEEKPMIKIPKSKQENSDWYDTDTDSAFYLTSDSDLGSSS